MDSLEKIIEEMQSYGQVQATPYCVAEWASRLEALRGAPVAEVADQDEDEIVCILKPGAKVWIGDNLYAAPQQADKPGE